MLIASEGVEPTTPPPTNNIYTKNSFCFHFYFGYLKFGLGRASRDAMQDIRNLHLTRKEAVRLVERFDSEFPIKHFDWMLDYLNINEK
mgnify:CR=1 FL=1